MSVEAECILDSADECAAVKTVDVTVDAVRNAAQENVPDHGSDVACREQVAERLYAVREL